MWKHGKRKVTAFVKFACGKGALRHHQLGHVLEAFRALPADETSSMHFQKNKNILRVFMARTCPNSSGCLRRRRHGAACCSSLICGGGVQTAARHGEAPRPGSFSEAGVYRDDPRRGPHARVLQGKIIGRMKLTRCASRNDKKQRKKKRNTRSRRRKRTTRNCERTRRCGKAKCIYAREMHALNSSPRVLAYTYMSCSWVYVCDNQDLVPLASALLCVYIAYTAPHMSAAHKHSAILRRTSHSSIVYYNSRASGHTCACSAMLRRKKGGRKIITTIRFITIYQNNLQNTYMQIYNVLCAQYICVAPVPLLRGVIKSAARVIKLEKKYNRACVIRGQKTSEAYAIPARQRRSAETRAQISQKFAFSTSHIQCIILELDAHHIHRRTHKHVRIHKRNSEPSAYIVEIVPVLLYIHPATTTAAAAAAATAHDERMYYVEKINSTVCVNPYVDDFLDLCPTPRHIQGKIKAIQQQGHGSTYVPIYVFVEDKFECELIWVPERPDFGFCLKETCDRFCAKAKSPCCNIYIYTSRRKGWSATMKRQRRHHHRLEETIESDRCITRRNTESPKRLYVSSVSSPGQKQISPGRKQQQQQRQRRYPKLRRINNDFGGRGICMVGALYMQVLEELCCAQRAAAQHTAEQDARCPSYFTRAPLYTSSIVEDHPASKNDDLLLRAGLSTKNKKLKR
ncbi:unnamed protein product, partial [Trichogramma brassicae]